jgi:adiponectin receptor
VLKDQIDSDAFDYIDVFHHSPNPQHIPRWPIIVFLLSAAFCLLCSTFFHLFYPMSSSILFLILESYAIFSRFDYAGISLLIAGSTFPPFYYSMYCYLEVALVYEIIEMTFAISLFILSVFEWMHRP